jgi:hypothetical protein
MRTREYVRAGWRQVSAILESNGDHALADAVRSFESRMSPARTDKEWLARDIVKGSREQEVSQREPQTR